MKMHFFKPIGFALIMTIWIMEEALAAAASPNLLKAKQEAEAKDYAFKPERMRLNRLILPFTCRWRGGAGASREEALGCGLGALS